MDLAAVREAEVQNDQLHADTQHPQEHTGHRAHHPGLTGYRLLVILLTAIFGLSKAGLSYNGQSTAPTTLDWMYGVVVFILYVPVPPYLCCSKFEPCGMVYDSDYIGLGFMKSIHLIIWGGSSKWIIYRCSGGLC